MGAGEWEVLSEEHTFSTGRTATLLRTLPMKRLVRQGILTAEIVEAFDEVRKGKFEDAARAIELTDLCVQAMFVDPRISLDGKHEPEADGKPALVPIEILDEGELNETLELAFASMKRAAGFRDDRRSPGPGGNSKDVRDTPKRPARSRTRKPGGVRAQPKAG